MLFLVLLVFISSLVVPNFHHSSHNDIWHQYLFGLYVVNGLKKASASYIFPLKFLFSLLFRRNFSMLYDGNICDDLLQGMYNVIFRWFHGKINRRSAEALLMDYQRGDGSFLVRESTMFVGDYSLSFV